MDAERWAGALDYLLLVPGARGRLLEARGEIQAAIASFRQAEAVAAAGGLLNPGLILTSRAPLAILLAQVGERAEAEAIVALFEEHPGAAALRFRGRTVGRVELEEARRLLA
jgi:hypothetical protein